MRRPNLLFLFVIFSLPNASLFGEQGQGCSATATQISAAPPTGHSAHDKSPAKAPEQPRSEKTKLDLTPDANGNLSQEQMRQLFRVLADKDKENDKRQRDYTYVERDVENHLDAKGQVKSTESETYEVMEIYGKQVNHLIQKDDKPLSDKDAAKEEKRIQKIVEKRKNESDSDKKKREEKEEKDREDGRKFVSEVADAYDFKLVGTELIGGREAWVIDAEPRAGFVPHMEGGKFLSKLHGRVWVDKGDLQVSKMDVEAIDTLSLGWVLARVQKGAHATLEQTRVNDEVWLPRHVSFNVDARIALLKHYKIAGDQTFRDYKKFRTSATILGYAEARQP
jgi:hypothetical protein